MSGTLNLRHGQGQDFLQLPRARQPQFTATALLPAKPAKALVRGGTAQRNFRHAFHGTLSRRFIFIVRGKLAGLARTARRWHQLRKKISPPGGAPPKTSRGKSSIPGKGHSSPVIWEDKVFLLTCLPGKGGARSAVPRPPQRQNALAEHCLKTPLETLHRLNSRASSTPVTDGKLIYVTAMKVDNRKITAPNVGEHPPDYPRLLRGDCL